MSVSTEQQRRKGGFAQTLRVIVQALILALVIRTFLFQSFNIPSGSMEATLLVGDYLFLSKYSYGYSHYSLPFSPPLFTGRIIGFGVERALFWTQHDFLLRHATQAADYLVFES